MKRYLYLICLALALFSFMESRAQKYAGMAQHSTRVFLKGIYDSRIDAFEQNTKTFLDEINKAYVAGTKPRIPESAAHDPIGKLISNHWAISPFFSVRTNVIENILDAGDGRYEVRNLQIVLEKADEDYKQQDAVLVFDRNGRIIDFKIALAYHSVNRILQDTTSVTDFRRRQMIINFVENFRTSYNLKDLKFLNNVFSDKALIITGKVTKKKVEGKIKLTVEYKKQTKEQYLTNLKTVFNNAKYLNINFDSITVVNDPRDANIYGVNLVQTWNSESVQGGKYQDTGYVFLIIDFSDEKNPMIWVRTWANENYFSLNSVSYD